MKKENKNASKILGVDKESDIYKKKYKEEENSIKIATRFMIKDIIQEYEDKIEELKRR